MIGGARIQQANPSTQESLQLLDDASRILLAPVEPQYLSQSKAAIPESHAYTRPLCPYPKYARYTGLGNAKDERNFMSWKTECPDGVNSVDQLEFSRAA